MKSNFRMRFDEINIGFECKKNRLKCRFFYMVKICANIFETRNLSNIVAF